MSENETKAQAEVGTHKGLTQEQQEERKRRVLTKGTPSVVSSIADAVVIKNRDLFFLARQDGNVPGHEGHGHGLYYHDCRYLNTYDLKIAETNPSPLVASAQQGYAAIFELTNPDIRMKDGSLIEKEQIGIKWQRVLDGDNLDLHDAIDLQNYSLKDYSFHLVLTFRAEFEDVFAVRGLLPEKLGKLRPAEWKEGVLLMRYDGADGLYRSLEVSFSEKPARTGKNSCEFDINLKAREVHRLVVLLHISETPNPNKIAPEKHPHTPARSVEEELERSADRWLAAGTHVETDSLLVNDILERSLLDLLMLRSSLRGFHYIAAGLPWFDTLFGRDSAIVALQSLAYHPHIAEETLKLLASYQGHEINDYKDEQPGKILHSIRIGEMAHTGEIPHSPYYGSVDATLLFLILISRHAQWTGDLSLFKHLRPKVEKALEWVDKYGDTNHDGYVDYESNSEKGLANQGWKDSGDAIVNADGSIARPPIALVEVQGYTYMAKNGIADLLRRTGDYSRAQSLVRGAEELRTRFNKDFWLQKEGFYAMALQKDGEPCAVRSSNPGQALWTGIVDKEKAKLTADMLLDDDMFSGWGVRTMSSRTRVYNPIAYHLCSVWPHDNSLIVAGLRRYGLDDEAQRICSGIMQAAMHFSHYRLPELFAGFDQKGYGEPVHYPVACHPQAWAAGSVPFMLSTLLGLVPEGFDKRLRIVRPLLPDFTDRVRIKRLKVGAATADLSFTRASNGQSTAKVEVLGVQGDLDVQIED